LDQFGWFLRMTDGRILTAAAAVRQRGAGTAGTLDEMGRWTYGLPYATALPNGEVLVAYYAGTSAGTSIRFARLAL